jgi:hypothetical protein
MAQRLKILASVGLAAALLAGAGAAQAHHSFAMFDATKTVTLKGSVKGFQWTNPHAILFVYGAPVDGGQPTTWSVELTSPGNLTRLGWTKRSLNPGDAVLVDISPLRDGQPGGGFKKVTLAASGQVLTSSFKDQERPDLHLAK